MRLSDEQALIDKQLDMVMCQGADVQRRLVLEDRRLDVFCRIIGFEVTPFHMGLIKILDRARRKGRWWRLWLAPRGFGKSTVLTIADCMMQAELDPNIRIMIGSRTKDQAAGILEGIKGRYKVDRYRELFGDKCERAPAWGERRVTINTRQVDYPEPTFYAAGADGAVASKHFDMIKADDLMDERNARTEGEREKIHTFVYKTMVPTLMIVRENGQPGEFDAIGTRYHPHDIYNHFETKDPNFKSAVFLCPALIDPSTGQADPQGISTCERFAPTEKLKNRRAAMGSAHFDSQMQQSTKRMQGDIFKEEYFRHYDDDPHELVERLSLKVWSACDLAIGEDTKGDEYADYVIGIDNEGRWPKIYLLDCFHGHVPYTRQIARTAQIFAAWSPMRHGIEANAFQKSRLGSVYRELGPEIGDRCRPIMTHKDKVTRAWQLSAMYENGRILHRRTLESDLEDQLVEFPRGKYDDMMDALDLAIRLGTVVGARKRRRERVGVIGPKRKARALI